MYAYVDKTSGLSCFKNVSKADWDSSPYGKRFEQRYPLTASIKRYHFITNMSNITGTNDVELYRNRKGNKYLKALTNTINHYRPMSKYFDYDQYYSGSTHINMIDIPSIFYGSSIKKGTVKLKYYYTGTLIGEARDINEDGALMQVTKSNDLTSHLSGAVGVVLYKEGIILLTSSFKLNYSTDTYVSSSGIAAAANPSWEYFFAGLPPTSSTDTAGVSRVPTKSTYELKFSGTTYVPYMTMLATAPEGILNYSNNPTFLETGSYNSEKNSTTYTQKDKIKIKNVVKSDHESYNAPFRSRTYISKIGLYDENRNLIGIAKLATPIKKTEERELTFKIKLEM